MQKLFITDPALSSHQGHHHSVTKAFSTAAEENDLEVIWLVNKNYNIDSEELIKNRHIDLAFSHGTYDGYKEKKSSVNIRDINKTITTLSRYSIFKQKIKNAIPVSVKEKIKIILNNKESTSNTTIRIKESLRPEQEIYRALKRNDCCSNDIVLFHTCDAHTYRDVVAFFAGLATMNEWNKFPRFVLSTPYDDLVMPHNKTDMPSTQSVNHLKALGLIDSRVFLYAENELLSNHLSKLWGVKVKTLYVPQKPLDNNSSWYKGRLNIMYLGAARTEKGFNIIVEAVITYLNTYKRKDIHFTIQASKQIMGYTPDVKNSVDKLKQINDRRLSIIDEVQTPKEFNDSIASSDVLLLCYDDERYNVRSSGIAVEGVLNKKNIISTKGIFPSFLAGDSCVEIVNRDDIINAINNIADNREHYLEAATKRSEWLRKQCSIEPLLESMNCIREDKDAAADNNVHISNAPYDGAVQWQRLI